ncbi:MAG: hypothetical protein CSB44_11215 [Gammaproteobacteria bacterium]|nr:MAG: hypothetical protein CSB44_11215 [Gammaproteobacteria bacterium]
MALGPLTWATLLLAGIPLAAGLPDALTLLLLSIVSPVLEEFVFRGGLQSWLLSRRCGKLANPITAAVFAAFHLFRQPPLWAALIFLPALVFGWSYERTGERLAAPILLHAFYNIGFALLFVGSS